MASSKAFETYRNEQGLTRQEQVFIFAFIREGDGRRAAEEAGVPAEQARAWAAKALAKPAITTVLEAEQKRIAQKFAISAEKVLGEMARVAFSNLADFSVLQNDGTRTVDLSQTTRDELAAISELTTETRFETSGTGKDKTVTPIKTTKIKLYPKMDALRALGTNLNLLTNKTELTGANGGPIEIKGGGVSALLAAIAQRSTQMRDAVTGKMVEDADPAPVVIENGDQ